MKSPANRFAQLALISMLSACSGGVRAESVPVTSPTGPAADYPMVIGEPFVIDGVTHTPIDRLNYDAVGYAATGAAGGASITAAHRTMPLPSYLEVTALDTGRTILVRVERRGPMTNARLVELSPGAAAQLGISGNPRAPVRIRRVNPPEIERAALRAGQPAPVRMDTPKSLLTVLTRRLSEQDGTTLTAAKPAPAAAPVAATLPQRATPAPAARPTRPTPVAAAPAPATSAAVKPAGTAAAPANVVQVGAYSSEVRAKAVASKLGAQVVNAGRLWRVRLGPFASTAEAQAALAKARAAGYTDARIQRAD